MFQRRLASSSLAVLLALVGCGVVASAAEPTGWAGRASDRDEDVVIPREAGVIDLTQWSSDPELNADPAAGNDDRPALQAALDACHGQGAVLFLPAGIYELGGGLTVPILKSNRASAYTILQGGGRDRTIVRLEPAGEGVPPLEGAVLSFQVKTADAFRNAVRDLTIEVGAGHPEAAALRFVANNQGVVRSVTLRAAPESGRIGLDLATGANGPLLVDGLLVEGFDLGIRTAFQVASQTFESIELRGQRRAGWANEADQNIFVRGLRSENAVVALANTPFDVRGQNAVATLLDATLLQTDDAGVSNDENYASGTSAPPATDKEAATQPSLAIRTEERLYARNVRTPGYDRPVQYSQVGGWGVLAGNKTITGDSIDEYWSEGTQQRKVGGTFELFEHSPDTTLNLGPGEPPRTPVETDLAKWASPTQFLQTNRDGSPSGLPGDRHDDTRAIQAAIDSGATTIFLARRATGEDRPLIDGEPGSAVYIVDGTVRLGPSVERLQGFEARLNTYTGTGRLVVLGESERPLVLERFATSGRLGVGIVHASGRGVVMRNIQGLDYRPVGAPGAEANGRTGPAWFFDTVGPAVEFRRQEVAGWQFNTEPTADVTDPDLPNEKILIDEARVCLLGTKIENAGTIARVVNGGQAELLGVYRNNSNPSGPENPAFVVDRGALSVVNFDAATAAGNAYAVWIRETRRTEAGLETRESPRFGGGHVLSAFDEHDLWAARETIVIDNDDAGVAFEGPWQRSSSLPGGFLDEDFAFAPTEGDRPAVTVALGDRVTAQSARISLRWVNDRGGSNHARHTRTARVAVDPDGPTGPLEPIARVFDQTTDGGRWQPVATCRVTSEAVLTLTADDGRKVVFDGVRLDEFEQPRPNPDWRPASRTVEPVPVASVALEVVAGESFAGRLVPVGSNLSVSGPRRRAWRRTQPLGRATIERDGRFRYTAFEGTEGLDVVPFEVRRGQNGTDPDAQAGPVSTGFLLVSITSDHSANGLAREPTAAERREQAAAALPAKRIETNGKPRQGLTSSGQWSRDEAKVAVQRFTGTSHLLGPQGTFVIYDLGETADVHTLRLWNLSLQERRNWGTLNFRGRGVSRLRVSVADSSEGPFESVTELTPRRAFGSEADPGELFVLPASARGRFVRLELMDRFDPPRPDDAERKPNDWVGFTRVKFRGRLSGE